VDSVRQGAVAHRGHERKFYIGHRDDAFAGDKGERDGPTLVMREAEHDPLFAAHSPSRLSDIPEFVPRCHLMKCYASRKGEPALIRTLFTPFTQLVAVLSSPLSAPQKYAWAPEGMDATPHGRALLVRVNGILEILETLTSLPLECVREEHMFSPFPTLSFAWHVYLQTHLPLAAALLSSSSKAAGLALFVDGAVQPPPLWCGSIPAHLDAIDMLWALSDTHQNANANIPTLVRFMFFLFFPFFLCVFSLFLSS
jgi:hypothetical protein